MRRPLVHNFETDHFWFLIYEENFGLFFISVVWYSVFWGLVLTPTSFNYIYPCNSCDTTPSVPELATFSLRHRRSLGYRNWEGRGPKISADYLIYPRTRETTQSVFSAGRITQNGPNKKQSGRKNLRPNFGHFCTERAEKGRTS
jgi:hypothetical protein